jgi:hypothetical protein
MAPLSGAFCGWWGDAEWLFWTVAAQAAARPEIAQ